MTKTKETPISNLIDKINIVNKIDSDKDIFLSESFEVALAFASNAIKNKKFIAITGSTGSGKTYLIRYLANFYKNDSSTLICHVENHEFIKVGLRQVYEALLFDIQPGRNTTRSNEPFIRQVKHILTA
jgi:type II secretory pathway predicted ATPase ExeA